MRKALAAITLLITQPALANDCSSMHQEGLALFLTGKETAPFPVRIADIVMDADYNRHKVCLRFNDNKLLLTKVTPTQLCVDIEDDKAAPKVTASFPSGQKRDVSEMYSAVALRPMYDGMKKACEAMAAPEGNKL